MKLSEAQTRAVEGIAHKGGVFVTSGFRDTIRIPEEGFYTVKTSTLNSLVKLGLASTVVLPPKVFTRMDDDPVIVPQTEWRLTQDGLAVATFLMAQR